MILKKGFLKKCSRHHFVKVISSLGLDLVLMLPSYTIIVHSFVLLSKFTELLVFVPLLLMKTLDPKKKKTFWDALSIFERLLPIPQRSIQVDKEAPIPRPLKSTKPISRKCSTSITPEKVRKPNVSWRFQG